jgi:hypothetical protein
MNRQERIGMEAPRTKPSAPHKGQSCPDEKKNAHAGSGLLHKAFHFVSRSLYPWCRDHIVSFAMLLAFPTSIGMYYWTRPEAESSPLPSYLKEKRNDETLAPPPAFPKLDPPRASRVAGSVSMIPETSVPLAMANDLEEGDALPPLPIAVDHPKPISRANDAPTLAWPGLKAPAETPTTGTTFGVWLTGSIEDDETAPNLIQNASRVHELTIPSRN